MNAYVRKTVKKFEMVGKWLVSSITSCRDVLFHFYCNEFSIMYVQRQPSLFMSKSRLWHRCFPVNFAKFSRTTKQINDPIQIEQNNNAGCLSDTITKEIT